ncbi:MAG: biotin/lipoyl-binding protein, partial [Burkholderiales bacterium]|nr:biotin/lipoyl-binding protein [Burkholderiales bacterium]
MKNAIVKKNVVTDVASQHVEVLEVNTDAASHSRLGWIIVLVGVVGFFLWASLAKLDKGVPLSGTVAVSTNRKIIQHQTGGTVDEILVKDGDVVKAGQALVRMNDVNAKASAEIARVQLYAAQAIEARLLAERSNAKTISFPADLEKAKNDPRVASTILIQQQLFTTRQLSIQSEMGSYDENIAGLKSQLSGLKESMVSKKQQQQILKEQLDSMRDLAKDGYIARNRLLDVERTYAQINGGISEDIGNMGRISRQIAEFGLRKMQRQQDYQKENRT